MKTSDKTLLTTVQAHLQEMGRTHDTCINVDVTVLPDGAMEVREVVGGSHPPVLAVRITPRGDIIHMVGNLKTLRMGLTTMIAR